MMRQWTRREIEEALLGLAASCVPEAVSLHRETAWVDVHHDPAICAQHIQEWTALFEVPPVMLGVFFQCPTIAAATELIADVMRAQGRLVS